MNKQSLVVVVSLLCLVMCHPTLLLAQGTISIDHKTQRFIGDVSALDRSKYLTGHLLFNSPDADFNAFKSAYNIDPGYIGSRQFWSPLGKVKNGNIPTNVPNKFNGVRVVTKGLVGTGRAGVLMHDETVDYSTVDVSAFSKQLAAYAAQSYKDEWSPMQEFIEPFNEPMVHARDFYPENFNKEKNDSIITHICLFHRDLGQAIHAVPELANLKMMGYASAFPEFEQNGFDLWNRRYKKFIDLAGADVDVFSVHLYDGSGINNTGGRRSGSNAEAILDIIEAYSFIALDTVKPIAVTEYGRLVLSQPGWPGSGISNYEPVENSQAVRSQIHMVMNFMERGDLMATTIPFSVGKSDPLTDKFSRAALFIEQSDGSYELTERKLFYEIWKDVKGDRVLIHSTNIDVQTQAFVDGNNVYVVLNNLNDATQTVSLDLLSQEGLQEVGVKRVKIYTDKIPALTEETLNTAPASISLEYGETAVLTYQFDAPITFENEVRSHKYYATTYLAPIVANTTASFTFEDVDLGASNGFATLRLGIGRELGKSVMPTIRINDQVVNITRDIIRGYDQHNRNQFFGVLEIPIEIRFLSAGTNTVQVAFPDNGGHISSAILQVQTATQPLAVSRDKEWDNSFTVYPNPVTDFLNMEGIAAKHPFQIYDIQGRLIRQGTLGGGRIDLRTLPSGIYLLKVEKEIALKFVKE